MAALLKQMFRSLFPKRGDPFSDQFTLLQGKPVEVIFDVGAHVGQTTLSYLNHFPQATIHAFEPFPESYQQLCKHVGDDKRVKTHPIALDESAGKKTLYVNTVSDTNSLLANDQQAHHWVNPHALQSKSQIQVGCETLLGVCRQELIQRIDILKLDTQGS